MNGALRDMAAGGSGGGRQRGEERVQDDTTRPRGGCDRSWAVPSRLLQGQRFPREPCLLGRNVLIASAPRHWQAVILEPPEAGIDHVRVAAMVGGGVSGLGRRLESGRA